MADHTMRSSNGQPYASRLDFVTYSTSDLRNEVEHFFDLRADVLASGDGNQQAMEYLAFQWGTTIAPVVREVERRDANAFALASDPLAPSPSRRNVELMELAADLKRAWPIDRFCTDLLAMRLQGRGDRLRGRCPLPGHDDSDPSFTVYVHDNRAWCFGCQRGGDVLDLTRHYFSLATFREAVERLQAESRPWLGGDR